MGDIIELRLKSLQCMKRLAVNIMTLWLSLWNSLILDASLGFHQNWNLKCLLSRCVHVHSLNLYKFVWTTCVLWQPCICSAGEYYCTTGFLPLDAQNKRATQTEHIINLWPTRHHIKHCTQQEGAFNSFFSLVAIIMSANGDLHLHITFRLHVGPDFLIRSFRFR